MATLRARFTELTVSPVGGTNSSTNHWTRLMTARLIIYEMIYRGSTSSNGRPGFQLKFARAITNDLGATHFEVDPTPAMTLEVAEAKGYPVKALLLEMERKLVPIRAALG